MDQVRVSDRRAPGFFIVDNEVIADYIGKIGTYGLAVYCALAYRAGRTGECWPSMARVGADSGCSARKAVDTVALLEREGLLSVERREGLPSVITLLPIKKTSAPRADVTETPLHDVQGGSAPRADEQDSVTRQPPRASARGGKRDVGFEMLASIMTLGEPFGTVTLPSDLRGAINKHLAIWRRDGFGDTEFEALRTKYLTSWEYRQRRAPSWTRLSQWLAEASHVPAVDDIAWMAGGQ